jgi:hypothetical protein
MGLGRVPVSQVLPWRAVRDEGLIPRSRAEGAARYPYVTVRPLSADVADFRTSPPARAEAPRVRVRFPLGANRPAHGLVVRRVRDRFRMRDV